MLLFGRIHILEVTKMKGFAYYNGKFAGADHISIPLSDRSIYFGDGVYDMALAKGDKIFDEELHISRLLGNAERIGLAKKYSYDDIEEILTLTLRKAGYAASSVYFQLSRGGDERIHSATSASYVNLLVLINAYSPPEECFPIKLTAEEDKRYFFCNIKTLNLFPAVMASTRAERLGFDETVFHRGATVTECAHSNIAIVKDGILITHPTGELILPGITRRRVLDICRDLGIDYSERAFTLPELFSADEILVTSTTKLVRRADSIDGISVGCRNNDVYSAISEKLLQEYREF